MSCRNDPDDPRKCERCGNFLWVAEEGLYCGECGSVMPCTMRVLPMPSAPIATERPTRSGRAPSA
ncbi:MAG: hypothetical protein ACRECT_07260 [Thermoplasmata archaeon]